MTRIPFSPHPSSLKLQSATHATARNIFMPSKNQTIYLCSNCDAQYLGWQGRCTECGSWGTVKTETVSTDAGVKEKSKFQESDFRMVSLLEVASESLPRLTTNIADIDTVLGSGIVPGSFILLSGDPGIGKSTLVLQILNRIYKDSLQIYITGEETQAQVKLRAERLQLKNPSLRLLSETNVEKIIAAVETFQPQIAVIDSIQTVTSSEVGSEPGSANQIKAATMKLLETCKKTNIPIIITGHVTKEGNIAGPKLLEHYVDVVLYLEGEKETPLRILRANKNRFGSTQEVGVFEMAGSGLTPVQNASLYFLGHEEHSFPGTVTTTLIQGNKTFFLEIQALVSKSYFGYPVRKASGFDQNRLNLLCAVISNRLKLPLDTHDVYLNVVGGLKLFEPAFDLAVCAAIISALINKTTSPKSIFFGEVGLGGEVRAVSNSEKRVREAEKLNYQQIITAETKISSTEISIVSVKYLSELVKVLS
jgi:DNA repair protein RadA/Sms